jgi:hypothetical protein
MSFYDDHLKVPRTLAIKTSVPNVCLRPPVLPETVYIIAGGPNGAAPALTIPDSECVIACNSAILMPRKFSWWIAFDHRIVNYGWWRTVELNGCRTLFSARLLNRLVMRPEVRQVKADYYFEYIPHITWPHGNDPKAPKMLRNEFYNPKLLRGGTTVSGVAIQFAHLCGVKNIVLCGVDMFGRQHWDGFDNPDPFKLCGGIWPWAEPLQILCEETMKRGTKVWTVSETALRLPEWKR